MNNHTQNATGTESEQISFAEAFELINPHLYTVEERIRAQAKSFDPAVEGYVSYVCGAGGKRLRPALALLSAGATGKITASHVDLAVILELIHIATLVHDDIMDGRNSAATKPRQMPNGEMPSPSFWATASLPTPYASPPISATATFAAASRMPQRKFAREKSSKPNAATTSNSAQRTTTASSR